jgi:hypothetical protein
MAKGDFRVRDGHRWNAVPYYTKAGQTAIKAGELVIQDTSGDEEYVQIPANGASNTAVWVGLAVSNDTNSASADGIVYVVDALDAEFIGKATTWANVTKAVMNTKVTLDVASTVQTLDEDDTTNGCFLMLNYNTDRQEVAFRIDASTKLNA